jgi:ribonuclease T1
MNNPKVARIIAAVVIAMLVITLAAALFGCSASKPATSAPSTDPDSGLVVVAVAGLPKEAQQTLTLIDQGGPFPYDRDGVVFSHFEKILPKQDRGLLPRVHREDPRREGSRRPSDRDREGR